MKVRVDFQELTEALGYLNTLLGDKIVDDKSKTIIFRCSEGGVSVLSYSVLGFCRVSLEGYEVELEAGETEESEWSFQLRAGELNGLLGSFSGLSRTVVTDLFLSRRDVKVLLEVVEEPRDGEDERLHQISRFSVDSLPLKGKVLGELEEGFPEDVHNLPSNEILLYLSSMQPNMDNSAAGSTSNQLQFAEDWVFVMSPSSMNFMRNKLSEGGVFSGVSLGYGSVTFLRKVCGQDVAEVDENVLGNVEVAKSEKYLCVRKDGMEAFLYVKPVRANFQAVLKRMSKQNGIVFDRMYFKDVLRRLSVSGENGVLEISTGKDGELVMGVSGDSFNQVVPVKQGKGEVEGVKFRVPVQTLLRSVLGDDAIFGEKDLRLYIVPISSGYGLFLSDSTGTWVSHSQVKKYR